MTLRELINQVTDNHPLKIYLEYFPFLDFNINIYDIDLKKNLDIDPKIYIDSMEQQITIKVEG
jgi:hypothetical protein